MPTKLQMVFILTIAGAIFTAAHAKIEAYDPPVDAGSDAVPECPWEYRRISEGDPGSPKLIYRCPPWVPERCISKVGSKEYVVVIYDISPSGFPTNTRITESTESCLNDAAADSVLRWRYEASESGATDRTTRIEFQFK